MRLVFATVLLVAVACSAPTAHGCGSWFMGSLRAVKVGTESQSRPNEEADMTVKPIPEGYHSVTPYLVAKGADTLLDFVKKAFGADETVRMPGPGGSIGHAEVRIGDSVVMLADASEASPATRSVLHLYEIGRAHV